MLQLNWEGFPIKYTMSNEQLKSKLPDEKVGIFPLWQTRPEATIHLYLN